ncbi:hypothetical protein GGTG_05759 [Gaeumannomyces tritici R3-111a-1]|uniref:C2H2-type domain-containing protein n=1 Tax=Gaeumannomyces tritici (strain R3-111a-1) TaxID=644352 RepID=J3NWU8_GAET3|nr:hypothetical protein GGTG_05759 [Gaeumannomyces tritici R3-111a-1]EJT75830.1 hypothetical protein GGTG_05759 [Gaeumannomyces tritici R3-111a-1]
METAGAVAVGSSTTTTSLKRFAGQSVEGLLTLRSLILGVKDKDSPDTPPPRSVRILLESAHRLKGALDKLPVFLGRLPVVLNGSSLSPSSSSPNSATSSDNAVAGTSTLASSDAPQGAHVPSQGELRFALGPLELQLRACMTEVRLVVDGLRTQVADDSGSFRQSWKKIEAARDGTFEEFAGIFISQEQCLDNVFKKLDRQLDLLAQGKLESLAQNGGVGGITSGAGDDKLSTSDTEVAVEDISSTRSEAAESAVATKATLTAGRPSLNNGDGSGGVNGVLDRQLHRGSKYHYSCEAVTGIDGASEEREDGAIGCMYCARSFAHDDETTIHRLGFHIVRAHGFGLCNLNCTFETRSELLCHLKSFHAWSRGGRGDQGGAEDAIVDRYFLTQKRSTPRSTRLLGLEDSDVHPPRGMREDGEETGLLNLLVLNEILRVVNLDVKMDAPRPSATTSDPGETELAHELCLALSQLDRLSADARVKATAAAMAGTNSASVSATTTEGEKGQAGSSGSGPAGLGMEVDLDELVYHAACVQQELAVSSGGEDVLRHEALYSADQYRIDDLVCMYFPPRASPDRHRAWYVRPVEAGSGVPASIVTAFNTSIKGLGLTRLEPAGPLRTFRDAIRALGRAHMETTGAKTYMAIMPQLLQVSKILLRQDRRPPAAPTHSMGWAGDGSRQVRMVPMRSNTMPLLHQPMQSRSQQRLRQEEQGQQELRAANLDLLLRIQQRDAHRPATTTRERRLRWITDGGLNWWFLGMLERSASFRRLVRSGKAFPSPAAGSSRKSRPKPGDSNGVTADASKTKPAPYAWAVALLSSAGLPQGGGPRNGRSNMDRAINGNGNGNRVASNGDLSRTLNIPRGPTSPAMSLGRADRGSGSERSVGINHLRPQAGQAQQPRQQQNSLQQPAQQQSLLAQQRRYEADQLVSREKGKEKEGIVDQGLPRTLPNGIKEEKNEEEEEDDDDDDDDEDEDDDDEDDQISSDEESWESSSSD